MLRMDQVDGGARLEHHQHLGGSLDGRKERDGLLDAIIENSEAVLRQARHEFVLAIENAYVNFDDLGGGLNAGLRSLWSTAGVLRVQNEHKGKKKACRRAKNCWEKSVSARPTECTNQSRCRANPSTSR
jgi:hypothetical protein